MDIDNIDRWVGILGLIFGLIGIWLTIRYYKKSVRTKLLAIGYTDPLPLLLPFPEVTFTYRGSTQSIISRVFVLFWNRGSAPIEASDFIEPIRIQKSEKMLGVILFDKDAVTMASVSDEDKTLAIQLLRPGEAVILQIDAADEAYRPDLSVMMKSADMTTSMGMAWANLPFVAGGVVTFCLMMIAINYVLPYTVPLLLEYPGWAQMSLSLASMFAQFGVAGLIGLLTYFVVREIVGRSASPVAVRFFRLQTTVWDALPTWKRLKRKIERTTRQ
jgi:hypothetical protein